MAASSVVLRALGWLGRLRRRGHSRSLAREGQWPGLLDPQAASPPGSCPGQAGAQAVAGAQARQRARVCGVLQAVTYSAERGKPVLVGQLSDGTGRLDLVWLGRRRVAGIAPGRWLVAEGMVAEGRTRLRIYNPAYELLGQPGRPGPDNTWRQRSHD